MKISRLALMLTLPAAASAAYAGLMGTMALTLPAAASAAYASLMGTMVRPLASSTTDSIDLGDVLQNAPAGSPTVLVLGTYPADFNMIEYAQKLCHYVPKLKQKGVGRILCTVNGPPAACELLKDMLQLPEDVELLSDEAGQAGRDFGCSTGWLPENDDVSPYAKLLGMLVGLGAWNTLPSVITGYIGNPSGTNGWIQQALAQGQVAKRWPDMALDVDSATGAVTRNAFSELPLVGGWGRRPLELATLRLQTMIGVSLAKWDELKPTDDRCLTQLGGLVVVKDGEMIYEWRDNGICATADFEKVLEAL